MSKVELTFLDGSCKEYDAGISAFEVATSISKSLAKSSVVAKLNGEYIDLYDEINASSKLELVTLDSDEALEFIRHDTAHLLAQAVKEIYPEVQVTIGPAITNGFYYDFAKEKPFTEEDLVVIEKKMHFLSKQNIPIKREVWDRNEAVEFFKSIGEDYKAEIIGAIPEGEKISLYRQGDFIDLCRGPHARSTGTCKHFKLTKVSGAYWRGDSKNQMLQRIYGTAWASKEQLDTHLHNLAEAVKRDHRKLGTELDLFHIQEEAVGSVFWHKNGAILYKIIEDFIAQKLEKRDYFQVRTPILIDKALWEKSGHWEKFRENIFTVESEDRTLAVKPMNCPAHVQIFNQKVRSYRDLPLRMAEFGCCHRNESSGSLHGIMRVRSFVQDDAHIFCTEDQILSETKAFSELVLEVYKQFGFDKVKIKFSDRPETRAGSDAVWDKAEGALKSAIDQIGLEYELNPGEGAFYGPKIEFVLTDVIGREWQCGTLQVDFVLPERLDAKYISESGDHKKPVMLHRAILGSFERFIGILIEQHGGAFPFWLAPEQVAVLNITNKVDSYAEEVFEYLKDQGIRVIKDLSSDKISYKVRKYSNKKIPYLLILGEEEAKTRTVNVRTLGSQSQETLAIDDIVRKMRG
ncbi:MAG: threonine--tRNA ligase [Rickettsiales bacterium]|jgi:threonyl-tRNA synthetase|nr:threonine--tRNA ligase [Rickettsiales bacterium]